MPKQRIRLNTVNSSNTMASICVSKHRKGTVKYGIKVKNDTPV